MSWVIKELEEVAVIKSGGTPSKAIPTNWGGAIPWVSAKDLKTFWLRDSLDHITDSAAANGAKMAPAGALMVLVRGMTLMKSLPVCITTRPMAFNQDLKAVIPHEGIIDSAFLGNYMVANSERIRSNVNLAGHGTGRLPLEALTAFPVPVPPLSEQRKIARILSTWDLAIEKQQQLIDAKIERKRGMMQRLLTGQERLLGYEKDWAKIQISDVLTPRNKRKEQSPSLPLFSLTISDGVTPKTERYNREALVKDKKGKKYKVVETDDIVFNPSNLRWGAIGICREQRPVLISPIYEVLHTRSDVEVSPEFLNHYLSSPRQIAIFASRVEGTLVERMAVKLDAFLLTEMSLPPIDEQLAINVVLNTCDRELDLHRQQLDALREQKRGLMQKLLTGEVRVK